MDDLQRRIRADLLTYMPAKLLPALTPFITVPIFTRLFTPEQYGFCILAFSLSEFLLEAACNGFASGTVRFYSGHRLRNTLPQFYFSIFVTASIATLIAVVLAALCLMLFSAHIDTELSSLLWLALLLFLLNAGYTILMNMLRAQERSRWYTALELMNKYGTVAFTLGLVLLLGIGVVGLLWGQILALAILLIPLYWLSMRGVSLRHTQLSAPTMTTILRYVSPLLMGNIAIWGLRLADRYIIEGFRGAAEVGLYSVSYNIASGSIDLIVALFMLVPGPILMRLWEESGRKSAEDALTEITRLFFVLAIPAVVGLWVMAAPVTRLLADAAYYDGYRAMGLVALSSFAFGLAQFGSFGLNIANRTLVIARNEALAAVCCLAADFILIPRWGFMGAAVSACGAYILLAALMAYHSRQWLSWHWPWRTLVHSLIAAGAMVLVVWIGGQVSGIYGTGKETIQLLGTMLLLIGGGAAIYFAVLILLGEIPLRRFVTRLPPVTAASAHEEARP